MKRCLPCNEPCPKCGNEDIHRLFRTVGDTWSVDKYHSYKITTKWYTHHDYRCTTTADHIQHHCRCCQYEWFTDPLHASLELAAIDRELNMLLEHYSTKKS